MRADDDGDATRPVELHQIVAHVACRLGIQSVQRLVEQQQVGASQQGHGQPQTLLHAQGEPLGAFASRIGQTDLGEQVGARLPRLGHPERQRQGHHVVHRAHIRQYAGILDQHAHALHDAAGLSGTGPRVHRPAEHLDAAVIRRGQSSDQLHRRGLAGAVPADEPVDRALRHRHPQIIDGTFAGVRLARPADVHHIHVRSFVSCLPPRTGSSRAAAVPRPSGPGICQTTEPFLPNTRANLANS